jgi:hypothetical protein
MRYIIFTIAVLLATASLAEESRFFAVTKSRLTGPKGTIRLTQIHELPTFMGEAECHDVLRAAKDASRFGGVYEQACLGDYPSDLQPLRQSQAIADGFAAVYTDKPFLLPATRVTDVYFYEFDSGPPKAVCERMLAHYQRRDKDAICLAPR